MTRNNVLSYFIKDIDIINHADYEQRNLYNYNNKLCSLRIYKKNIIIYEYNYNNKHLSINPYTDNEIVKWFNIKNHFITALIITNKCYKYSYSNTSGRYISKDIYINYKVCSTGKHKYKKTTYSIVVYYELNKLSIINYYYKFFKYIRKIHNTTVSITSKFTRTEYLNNKYELNYYSKLFRLINN